MNRGNVCDSGNLFTWSKNYPCLALVYLVKGLKMQKQLNHVQYLRKPEENVGEIERASGVQDRGRQTQNTGKRGSWNEETSVRTWADRRPEETSFFQEACITVGSPEMEDMGEGRLSTSTPTPAYCTDDSPLLAWHGSLQLHVVFVEWVNWCMNENGKGLYLFVLFEEERRQNGYKYLAINECAMTFSGS